MSSYGVVNNVSNRLAEEAIQLFRGSFEGGEAPSLVSVPGRVNLIGEHIDYHDLPVLPMAVQRRIWLAFRARRDARLSAISAGAYGRREFDFSSRIEPGPPGDWINYLKAAAQAVSSRWPLMRGIDVAIVSDLPPAAGLASSSALLIGVTLALLEANSILATKRELMQILPEGEQFVGTRGGGMDHAAVLASRSGCALLVRFAPVGFLPIQIPEDWRFLVAHSMITAEKSGAMRAEYNARRSGGTRALEHLGFASYRAAMEQCSAGELKAMAERHFSGGRLSSDEYQSFLHVTSEARRVKDAVAALRHGDIGKFGRLLSASHGSLRDRLRVSSAALDELVKAAMGSGALGARLTGAGFGGCVVILCRGQERDRVSDGLIARYYSSRAGFDRQNHLFAAEPSAGALYDTAPAEYASRSEAELAK